MSPQGELFLSLTKATLYTAVLHSGQFLPEFFAKFMHILNHFLFHIWIQKTHVTGADFFMKDRVYTKFIGCSNSEYPKIGHNLFFW